MFTGIDHVAIVVEELESAIASYSRAGFTVVRGGKHPIGTHNALIAFADGSYLELIAFLKQNSGHPWQRALEKGSGIVDFCMSTDDLGADVEAMRRAGAKIGDPSPLTRDRPDGYHLRWVLAIPEPPFNGQVPFLIKDETPRDERVPRERSHRNGAGGIRTLAIAVEDPGMTSRYYARVLGRPGAPVERADPERRRASPSRSVQMKCNCSRRKLRTALSRNGFALAVNRRSRWFSRIQMAGRRRSIPHCCKALA